MTGKRGKRETDSLAPFAPFCATHPRECSERSRVSRFLMVGTDDITGLYARYSRDVLSLTGESGREAGVCRMRTTNDVHGEDGLPATAVWRASFFRNRSTWEMLPDSRGGDDERREQGSDRRRHALLRLRSFV